MDPVPLDVTGGLPYSRKFRITNGVNIWSTVEAFEVRGQVRAKDKATAALVANLTPYLSREIDGNDIVVSLSMTGAATRTMNKGYYDILISDPGVEDAKALRVSEGPFNYDQVLTTAVGNV